MTARYLPSSHPKPGNFHVWLSGPCRGGFLDPCFFNSALSSKSVGTTSNATLTIYLRLHLVKRNTDSRIVLRTDKGVKVPYRDWNDRLDEFNLFKRQVKLEAEKFWNDTKFCLCPPGDYRGLDYPHSQPRIRPNIDCHFEIVWAKGSHDAHAVIDCFRPVASSNEFRSNAGGSDDGAGTGQWTSFDVENRQNKMKYSSLCEDPANLFAPIGAPHKVLRCSGHVAYETVCHEVGHLLGLPHVGEYKKSPACEAAKRADPGGGRNDASCYEGPDPDDEQNVMGAGMKLARWNAFPWAMRACEHTGISPEGWKVSLNRVLPRRIS